MVASYSMPDGTKMTGSTHSVNSVQIRDTLNFVSPRILLLPRHHLRHQQVHRQAIIVADTNDRNLTIRGDTRVIESQIPEAIDSDNPLLGTFLKQYYISQEFQVVQ